MDSAANSNAARTERAEALASWESDERCGQCHSREDYAAGGHPSARR
jgi:hypothetical protein